jgi:predicted DCC family thiol-disulfide oxidoreductase YuxK
LRGSADQFNEGFVEPIRWSLIRPDDKALTSQASTQWSNAMNSDYTVEMFYDGDCPLCMRETQFIRKLNHGGRIRFTNIAASDFDPVPLGKTHDNLMAEIHGRLPDGRWVTGVEVFRRLYDCIGFGPLVLLTRLPLVRQLLNVGYRFFAKNRLQLTGRCSENCSITPA